MFKVYLSHRICGGKDTMSQIEMDKNCQAARDFADSILTGVELVSEIDAIEIYVPGGPTEQFVSRAVSKRMLTVEQVLKIDCDIMRSKDMVIVWVPQGDTLNGGREVEVDFAVDHDIPMQIVSTGQSAVQFITRAIHDKVIHDGGAL